MITNYYLKLISNNIFNTSGMFTLPVEYQIGLSSTLPSVDGTNITEPNIATGYTRVIIDNDDDVFDKDEITGLPVNKGRLYFGESTKPWDSLKYYVIYDDNNNLLMYGELAKTLDVPIRTIVAIPERTLKLEVVNGSVM